MTTHTRTEKVKDKPTKLQPSKTNLIPLPVPYEPIEKWLRLYQCTRCTVLYRPHLTQLVTIITLRMQTTTDRLVSPYFNRNFS
jgi:hypothetical protein